MTPMRAKSDNEVANPSAGDSRNGPLNLVSGTAAESRPDELAVFSAPAAGDLSSPATARLEGGAIHGTVGASVAAVEEDSYTAGSVALLRGEITGGKLSVSGRTRANELLAELQEISGQVNRMMSQVDRAIDRLGVHAGEPLRR